MRFNKITRAISSVAVVLACAEVSRADFSYNFDNLPAGNLTPNTSPITTATLSVVGQDNWAITSGPSALIRNDAVTGFGGSWLSSQLATTGGAATDSITTRAGANLGVGGSRFATFQFRCARRPRRLHEHGDAARSTESPRRDRPRYRRESRW